MHRRSWANLSDVPGPMAAGVAYATGRNRTLAVAAPGVLAGAAADDDCPLTAMLLSGPAHGSLTLRPDGSFTYKPAGGFSGTDSFTYCANDGRHASAPATVTLTVRPSPAVKAVEIDDASARRSGIHSIVVRFSTRVTFDDGAFGLARTGGGGTPELILDVSEAGVETVVVLTFRGAGTLFGGLEGGKWTLRVRADRVRRADDPTVTMAADKVVPFQHHVPDWDVEVSEQTAFLSRH
jgi:hypothetical protein